jgi:hypothetical protein
MKNNRKFCVSAGMICNGIGAQLLLGGVATIGRGAKLAGSCLILAGAMCFLLFLYMLLSLPKRSSSALLLQPNPAVSRTI